MADPLKSLHMLAGDDWVPLAAWARFFVALGNTLGTSQADNFRKVIAISIPTRALAAGFCALGVVLTRVRVKSHADPLAHFERLRSLPEGTVVFYHVSPTKKRRCRFGGLASENGKEYAVVEDANTLRCFVPPPLCQKIEPLEGTMDEPPEKAKTLNVSVNGEFLAALLGRAKVDEFLRYSRIDCVIAGIESELRADMMGAVLGIATGRNGIVQGCLQDVLRVRRFLGQGPHKSDVVPTRSLLAGASDLPRAPVVIFDGAAPLLRAPAPSTPGWLVVILDRTETRFADAVAEINRRRAGGTPLTLLPPPDGVELVAFGERSMDGAA